MFAFPISSAALAPGTSHWASPDAWWPVLPLLCLLVLSTGVAVAVLLIHHTVQRPRTLPAQAKLARRYAAGDITEEQYRERLAVLRSHAR